MKIHHRQTPAISETNNEQTRSRAGVPRTGFEGTSYSDECEQSYLNNFNASLCLPIDHAVKYRPMPFWTNMHPPQTLKMQNNQT